MSLKRVLIFPFVILVTLFLLIVQLYVLPFGFILYIVCAVWGIWKEDDDYFELGREFMFFPLDSIKNLWLN